MRNTELSSRKRAVLAAIVKAYIESGEPVGSKILTGLISNAPSSATLRNEMNELCSLGLLTQPHTSAGRIPTSLGYKLYVDSLMQPSILLESTKNYIGASLAPVTAQQQNLPALAADALSSLTGFCAFSYYKIDDGVIAKDIEVLPLSKKSIVLLLVTSDGRAISRICNLKTPLSEELLVKLSNIISQKLKRKPLASFTKATLQNIVTVSGIDCFALTPLLTELFDMAYTSSKSQFNLCGSMKLYNICSPEDVRKIVNLANGADRFISVLEGAGDNEKVIFGNDIGLKELDGKALITSNYYSNNKFCGKIGIIGPDRMFYEQIIPSIEYTARTLGEQLSKAQKDMED